MPFNSFLFLLVFPLIFLCYRYVCSKVKFLKLGGARRIDNLFLLVLSYILYMLWKPAFALLLLGITAITFFFAILIDRRQAYGKQRYIIVAGVLFTLFPLAIFKYYHFINTNISALLDSLGMTVSLPGLNWAVPLGISFYSFQAVGYLFDVYYKRISTERSWWDYMLFVSFFPQITAGPISKAKDLLPQIKASRPFDYSLTIQGLRWLLWGYFLKTVIADRIALYVNLIFDSYSLQTGGSCLTAAVLYSFQIYADFAGYSLMAIGVGAIMGFKLINNFRRPYLSVSITDFWRRWHISLSSWLKDYIYIPLGGSRCSHIRNYVNIMATFLVSGIWHGANWTFIVWGLIHGGVQVVEKLLGLQHYEKNNIGRVFRIILCFALVTLAWVFFRMPSLPDAVAVLTKIATQPLSPIYTSTLTETVPVFVAPAVLLLTEVIEEFTGYSLFRDRHKVVRWGSYSIVIFAILLFGVLDASTFIYASF